METPDCYEYYQARFISNTRIIKAINVKKVVMMVIGIVLVVTALISIFAQDKLPKLLTTDTLSKLSGLLAGIYFVSANLVGKPNLEDLGKENEGLKMILKDFSRFEQLDLSQQKEINSNCEDLKKKLRTS